MISKDIGATVGHVGIEAKSLKHSRKFYETLLGGLGFTIVMDTEEGIGFGNQNFSVWLSEMQNSRIERKAPTGEEFVVADHLAILVQEKKTVHRIEEDMKKNGFEPLFPYEEHPQFEPGYFAASFSDPDNYIIEIYTREKTSQT